MELVKITVTIVGILVGVSTLVYNLRLRRLSPKEKEFVARFRKLVEASRLNDLQFLDVLPREWNWNLEAISDPKKIISNVTPKHLEWLSRTFGIPMGWLLCEDEAPSCEFVFAYKKPEHVRTELGSMGWLTDDLKMTVLAEDYGRGNEPLGRFILVFSHPLNPGEEHQSVWLHARLGTTLVGRHGQARYDAKAIARWYSMDHHHLGRIPIVNVDHLSFEAIEAGKLLIGRFIPRYPVGNFDYFEDRVLKPKINGKGESCVAIESDELDDVLDYYERRFAKASSESKTRIASYSDSKLLGLRLRTLPREI